MRFVIRVTIAVVVLAAASLSAGAASAPTRRTSIFFYPWYGTPSVDGRWRHWQQNGASPPRLVASNYYPVRGAYSSADPRVLRAQLAEIAALGVDEVVTSWWGRGSPEDGLLGPVLAGARAKRLSVAVHLEPYGARTAATARADLEYVRSLGVRRVYVYEAALIDAEDWAPVLAGFPQLELLAHTRLVGWARRAGFDGVYTYTNADPDDFARVCTQARAARMLCAPTVSPGFDARRASNIARVQPRRDGRTYDGRWRAAACARPDIVTIASYNEWHEGTQIEPARSSPPGARGTYRTYVGAYGLRGKAAERAYLQRTKRWVALFERGAACRSR